MVAPAQMRALVREYGPHVRFRQVGRKYDARAEEAEDERRIHTVAQVHVFAQADGLRGFSAQNQAAYNGPHQHRGQPRQPDDACKKGPDLRGIGAGKAVGRKRAGECGIDERVDAGDAGVDGRRGSIEHVG